MRRLRPISTAGPGLRVPLLAAVLTVLTVLAPPESLAQDTTVSVWSPAEITLTSDSSYSDPQNEVDVSATFTGPSGRQVTVSGFWNGRNRFLVRFAPRAPGRWTYRTSASDPTDPGLHGRTGVIRAAPAGGDHRFLRHGWLRVASDRRHLVHADGTPFFYLADTAWEITWKSRRDRVERYLDDRAEKGFTAVQIVVMSHQRLRGHGVYNRQGEPFFLEEDFGRLNPRYFDYLDWLVEEINEREMVAVLVPLWAYMMELYPDSGPQGEKLTRAESLHLAAYVGARYGAHNVIWMTGGDNKYDTLARRSFWGEFARTLSRSAGGGHLTTIHPNGFDASYSYFDNATPWLDFHAYQSGHLANDDYPWQAALRGYDLRPRMPVLNAEPTYEDIHSRFWKPGPHPRIEAVHVRRSIYESVLSGSFVGSAYGANGVWQWSTDELPGSHRPRYRVERAWRMIGSEQVGILRRLMEKVNWYRYDPAPNFARRRGGGYVASMQTYARALGYLPADGGPLDLSGARIGPDPRITWIDPVSGDTLSPSHRRLEIGDLDSIEPPDSSDWVFALRWSRPDYPREAPSPDRRLAVKGPRPHPVRQNAYLDLWTRERGTARLRIWNTLGQLVRSRTIRLDPGWRTTRIEFEDPGVYVYTITSEGTDGRPLRRTGTLTVAGN